MDTGSVDLRRLKQRARPAERSACSVKNSALARCRLAVRRDSAAEPVE